MHGRRTIAIASLAIAATIGAAGCTTLRESQVRGTERMLAEAGFTRHRAETVERDPDVAALSPHELTRRTRAGAVEYVYADPTSCKCLYVGGTQEYAEYRRLLWQRQIAQEWRSRHGDPWVGRRSMGGIDYWRPWW